jgi:hypothetical protein
MNAAGPKPSESHPAPEDRIGALRAHLRETVGAEASLPAVEMASALYSVAVKALERARPRYQELHSLGVQPSDVWLVGDGSG